MTTYISLAHASMILHHQIAEKYGTDPTLIDGLHFEVQRVPIGATGRRATILAAWPSGEPATPSNVCVAAAGEFDFSDRQVSEARHGF